MTIPYFFTQSFISPILFRDCITAMSMMPFKWSFPAPSCPITLPAFFLPLFFAVSITGRASCIVRNSPSFFLHCATKLILSTIINVFTFLAAINLMATTVLPKAVVPQRIPLSCSNKLPAARGCSSLSLPLNSTLIRLPWFVSSIKWISAFRSLNISFNSASHPLGRHKYDSVSSEQDMILGNFLTGRRIAWAL